MDNGIKELDDLREFVIELPEEGWWKDGADAFEKAGTKMLLKGFDIKETKEILSRLYSAVQDEFC